MKWERIKREGKWFNKNNEKSNIEILVIFQIKRKAGVTVYGEVEEKMHA